MKKILSINILLLMFVFILSGCKLSEENQAKIKDAQNELTKQKDFAEDIYGKLTTDEFESELSSLSSKYDELFSLDTSRLSDKEALEYLPKIDELTASYKSAYDKMASELKAEADAAAEAEKHIEILCRIINKSGLELSSIVFNNGADSASQSYLGDEKTLPSGRILEGIFLPVNTDINSFSLTVTDTLENVTEYTLSLDDLKTAAKEGIAVTLLDPENGTEITPYSSVPN